MTSTPCKPAPVHVDADAIRHLADVLDETGLSEIDYETDGVRIRLAKGGTMLTHAPAASPPTAVPSPTPAPSPTAPENHPGTVKAPMVGVAYLSSEPGAAAFVTVGQSVSEGQTLMLIEAMKTFNPVRAPRSGTLVSLLVSDAQAVEYAEPLAIIE